MPIQVSYPGVYVQEIASGQATTTGVSTASTAFADFFKRGPMGKAVSIESMSDFNRIFGGLDSRSEASYGISQYFLNGGQQAWVIRAADGTQLSAFYQVPITTPGLAARVTYATQAFERALKAANAASAAASNAQQEAAKVPPDPKVIQSDTTTSADQTRAAAEATRDAAVQAKAAADELALAINQAANASGPVPAKTAAAAEQTANAAQGAASAADANITVATAAQSAAALATQALQAGQIARLANDAAVQLQTAVSAIEATKTAANSTKDQEAAANKATSLAPAQGAATQGSASAATAADQAVEATSAAFAAAQTLVNYWSGQVTSLQEESKDTSKAQASLDAANTDLDHAQKLLPVAESAQDLASDSEIEAMAAFTTFQAQQAVGKAADAASQAQMVATGAGFQSPPKTSDPAGGVQAVVESILTKVLEFASAAANQIADLSAVGSPPASPPVDMEQVFQNATQAINDGMRAAGNALKGAKGAANNATVAASYVASGGPALAARAASGAVTVAATATADAYQNANRVKLDMAKAFAAAAESADKAGNLAEAAESAAVSPSSPPADIQQTLNTATTTAQTALEASDDTVKVATSVEGAAKASANLSETASASAEAAAKAAAAAVQASIEFSQAPVLEISAANPGVWGNNIEIGIELSGTCFKLTVQEWATSNGVSQVVNTETYPNLDLDPKSTIYAPEVVNSASALITAQQIGPQIQGSTPVEVTGTFLAKGNDGGLASADQLTGADGALSALENIEPAIFNILCLPAVANYDPGEASVANANANAFVSSRRAFYILDIPSDVATVSDMTQWAGQYMNAQAYNQAVYFPRLLVPDPLKDYRNRNISSSGTLAGIYARTDSARGVWKAPAGIDAVIQGATVATTINDSDNGKLNPLGINALRSFPIYGNISWGARTLAGADQLSSEWKYVPVRRLFNYVEESIYQSLKWAVFEPNNEILWSTIRVQVSTFLSGLFADGAFQGTTPAQAYYVTCDGTTTTPVDIDMGVVNVYVGLAPVKPAEFIVLYFQQIAGQTAA